MVWREKTDASSRLPLGDEKREAAKRSAAFLDRQSGQGRHDPLRDPDRHAQARSIAVQSREGDMQQGPDHPAPACEALGETIVVEGRAPGILPVGSCHVGMAVADAVTRGAARFVVRNNNQAHSTTEAIQLLRFHQAEDLRIPSELLDLCFSNTDKIPKDDLADADVLAFEICNPYPLTLNGIVFNRNLIVSLILNPMQNVNAAAASASQHWFWNGLYKCDEAVRVEAGTEMLKHMPTGTAHAEACRDVVRHAKVVEQTPDDIRNDLGLIREIIDRPLVGMTHTLRYFPDGRPVSWPAWLHKELARIFNEIGAPVVDPSTLVAEFGADYSLKADLSYYTPEFVTRLGDAIASAALMAMQGGLSLRAAI